MSHHVNSGMPEGKLSASSLTVAAECKLVVDIACVRSVLFRLFLLSHVSELVPFFSVILFMHSVISITLVSKLVVAVSILSFHKVLACVGLHNVWLRFVGRIVAEEQPSEVEGTAILIRFVVSELREIKVVIRM